MKNWSIKRILQINALVAVLMLALLAGTSFTGMTFLSDVMHHNEQVAISTQRQMNADMMHDAIRSDVLQVVIALEHGEYSALSALREDLNSHGQTLIKSLKDNAEAGGVSPEIANAMTGVSTVAKRYVNTAFSVGSSDEYDELVTPRLLESFNRDFELLEGEMESLSALIAKQSESAIAEAEGVTTTAFSMIGGFLVLSLLVIVGASAAVISAVTKPLQKTVDVLTTIEKTSNLTLRVPVDGNNEVSQLVRSFNSLMDAQQAIVRDVKQAALDLSDNSRALADAARSSLSVSETSNDTASSVAAAVEELSVSIAHMSEQAQEAHEASKASQRLSVSSSEAIEGTSREIQEISSAVRASAQVIDELEQAVLQISSIAKAIDEIAEQTNLLALNAAIEAARAGEQGRGFAVVADEVRSLAERTSKSTREIASTIDSIQAGTARAVESMQNGVARVEKGEEMSQRAKEAMLTLAEDADRAAQAISQITSSLMEQKAVGHDIGMAVEKVAQMSEKGREIASDTSDRASNLQDLALGLGEQVDRFAA